MTRIPPDRGAERARDRAPESLTGPPQSAAAHFTRLPSETIGQIGRFLDLAGLEAARAAAPALRRGMRHVFRSAEITQRSAPSVTRLAGFRTLAGTTPGNRPLPGSIAGLAADLRSRPLEALGLRILALPQDEQEAAVRSFLDVPVSDPGRPLLNQLRAAARQGRDGMLRREALLVLGGAAAQAVASGGGVQEVARAWGIVADTSVWFLDRVALLRSVPLLRHDQNNVPDTARQLGIVSPASLAILDLMAVVIEGLRAMGLGEPWQSVVDRLGLTDHRAIQMLRTVAVDLQIQRGQPPLRVAEDFGIEAEADRDVFLAHAVETVGREALEAGMDMRDVARWLGIHGGTGLSGRLAWIAMAEVGQDFGEAHRYQASMVYGGPAEAAVLMGGHVGDVARAFGIDQSASLRRLERLAVPRAADWLRSGLVAAPEAARRLGLVTQAGAVDVQLMALMAHGMRSIAAGEQAPQVAARLGIGDPGVLARMHQYAAFRAIDRGRPPREVIAQMGLGGEMEQAVLHYAVEVVGRSALVAGSTVPVVAERLGVQHDAARVDQLESIAVEEIGRYLVLEGFDPAEVAHRLGVRDAELVADAAARLQQPVDQPPAPQFG
jgi:hypothetical protein